MHDDITSALPTASKGCKRRAEDQLRVTSTKKQKSEIIETTSATTISSTSTVTVKVFPLFTKTSKKTFCFLDRQGNGTVLHGVNFTPQPRTKVAAFDLDGTLIATKSGIPFPMSGDDWRWWHSSVPSRLQALHESGYAIVIISNQGGLSHNVSKRRDQWEIKISQIAKQLPNLPFHIFAATKGNEFRKPRPGMWNCLTAMYAKHEVIPDLAASFYVGDAAGRPGDHSNSDKGLAKAIGISFHTPETLYATRVATQPIRSDSRFTQEFFLSDDQLTPPTPLTLAAADEGPSLS